MKLAVLIFRFFASLKLAIFLLLTLALGFAMGTFFESAYGTEAAKLLVYRSGWMNLLYIALVLNLAAAALDRLPWKKKHVGFVITHSGIILILTGSLLTRAYGVEGQMAIQEGEAAHRLILARPLLQLFSPGGTHLGTFPIPPKVFPWKGRETLGTSEPAIWLRRYYPKANREEKIEESHEGPPALQVVLESSFMKTSHWLLADDSERGEVSLGPATLSFTREPIVLPQEGESQGAGFLEFQFENSPKRRAIQIPLEQSLSKKVPLPGTPYEVTILRILKDAVVDQGRLIDQSDEWKNPACELMLESVGADGRSPPQEKHTVFSQFPDFPTLHGMKPSEAGVRIYYRRPEEGPQPKNELRFVWRENELPLYQIRARGNLTEGIVQLGEEQETGWMDFKFRAGHYYPHARARSTFSEAPLTSQDEENLSAIEVELEGGGEKKSVWLGQGDEEKIFLGGQIHRLLYGLRTLPLGFWIELRDFRVENYPGTPRPASFESDITLKDDFTGTVRDQTIRMNHPLRYRGFRVFQSGYQQIEGKPEVSIFTVAKDPGIPVKYAGAVVLIAGILTMFYTRRFSGKAGKVTGTREGDRVEALRCQQ